MSFYAPQALFLVAALLPVIFLWGCAAGLSGTFSISGTISPAASGSGTKIFLSGVSSASTTPDSSGNYVFRGLSNGTYAVTPSKLGFAFSPTSQPVMVKGANVSGISFTATAQQAQQTHSVALSWDASPSPVVGYNVYRSTVSGGQFARVNSTLIGGLAFTDIGLHGGSTYYYVTTAIDATGIESAPSNEVMATIP